MPTVLSILAFVTLAIGGAVEIIPTLTVKSNVPNIQLLNHILHWN
jgi:cytochrome c oxidase cbb3-type subunit I/II